MFREGNISDIERAGSLHQYLCKLHKDYGNVAAFKYGQSLVVSVSNPKHFVPRLQICDIPGMTFQIFFYDPQNIFPSWCYIFSV